MSMDFGIRPVGAPVIAPVVRPQPDAAINAVRTELPAPKTPTPPDASAGVSSNPQASDDRSRDIVIDRAAGQIVYRVVDNRTSEVVSQFPDEVRLRARAYLRSLDEAKWQKAQMRLDQKA
jgi:hypothetical protein